MCGSFLGPPFYPAGKPGYRLSPCFFCCHSWKLGGVPGGLQVPGLTEEHSQSLSQTKHRNTRHTVMILEMFLEFSGSMGLCILTTDLAVFSQKRVGGQNSSESSQATVTKYQGLCGIKTTGLHFFVLEAGHSQLGCRHT